MPLVEPADMLHGEPLPGWHGRFFHAASMTFAHYDLDANATPLHEHHHEQEEVWHIVEGEVAITVAGEERTAHRGDAVVVPPDVLHSVRPLGVFTRVVIADSPVRDSLPGNPQPLLREA